MMEIKRLRKNISVHSIVLLVNHESSQSNLACKYINTIDWIKGYKKLDCIHLEYAGKKKNLVYILEMKKKYTKLAMKLML